MLRILGGKGLCDLVVVKFEGQVIAAGLLLKDKRNWHLEYAASDSNFLKLGPNQYLIWECIKGAKEQGAEFFDFGRTAVWQESLLEFKDRWQADRHIILHRYYPEKSVDPHWSDPSQSLLARVNKKLPPLLVEWEGRLLYRHRG